MDTQCSGCDNIVDKEQAEQWNGFCDACLELGKNFEPVAIKE